MTTEFTYTDRFNLLRNFARIIHANINIKGGYILQKFIYETIRDATDHNGQPMHTSVSEEKKITLIVREGSNGRKTHKVDILIEDEHNIIAINSKGKSFNNTESQDSKLREYNWYLDSIKNNYPNKDCKYIILKDEYNRSDSNMGLYNYLDDNGIKVYNTEQYLLDNYNCDFYDIEIERQKRSVIECEKVLISEGYNFNNLYQLFLNNS